MDILFRQSRLRFSHSGQEKQDSNSNTSKRISYQPKESFNQGDHYPLHRKFPGQEAKDGDQTDSDFVTAIAAATFAISLRDNPETARNSSMASGNDAKMRLPYSRSLNKLVSKKGTKDAGDTSMRNAAESYASPASKRSRPALSRASSSAVGHKEQAENSSRKNSMKKKREKEKLKKSMQLE